MRWLPGHSPLWDCEIALASGVLGGSTQVTVATGDNLVTFGDLIVEEAGLSYDMTITCISTDGKQEVTAMSLPFHVHDYPTTGMLRETAIKFTFKGPYKKIENILNDFDTALGTVSCKGCPSSMGRRKREAAEQPTELCFSPLGKEC
jgi:hypothetical protein